MRWFGLSRKHAAETVGTAALVLASIAIVALTTYLTLFAPDDFTDNLYNLGVIRRSALPSSTHLLETSYSHWYFETEPMARAEDWHRSLPLLIDAFVARHWTAGQTALRIPHLLWVLALWATCLLTLQLVRAGRGPRSQHRSVEGGQWRTRAVPVLLITLLVTSAPFPEVLNAAFLDDLPAAVLVLVSFNLIVSSETWWGPAAAGAALGLAFWSKDMALIWIAAAPLLLIVAHRAEGRGRRLLPEGQRLVLLLLPCLLIGGGKIVWNYQDLGRALPHGAIRAVSARLIEGIPDPEHALYCVTSPAPAPDARDHGGHTLGRVHAVPG